MKDWASNRGGITCSTLVQSILSTVAMNRLIFLQLLFVINISKKCLCVWVNIERRI